jgi:hypothetical protein
MNILASLGVFDITQPVGQPSLISHQPMSIPLNIPRRWEAVSCPDESLLAKFPDLDVL